MLNLFKYSLNKISLQILIIERMEQVVISSINLCYDRKIGKFILSLPQQEIQQNVCEFLHTISFLVGKDIEEHLLNPDSRFDTIRIPLTASDKVVTLNIRQFIHLREAYSRQMFLLKLEDLLMRKGISASKLY